MLHCHFHHPVLLLVFLPGQSLPHNCQVRRYQPDFLHTLRDLQGIQIQVNFLQYPNQIFLVLGYLKFRQLNQSVLSQSQKILNTHQRNLLCLLVKRMFPDFLLLVRFQYILLRKHHLQAHCRILFFLSWLFVLFLFNCYFFPIQI